MKILFLGDVVGVSGCSKVMNNLKKEIEKKKYRFCSSEWREFSRAWSWSNRKSL